MLLHRAPTLTPSLLLVASSLPLVILPFVDPRGVLIVVYHHLSLLLNVWSKHLIFGLQCKTVLFPTGQCDPKIISPTSFSREVFYSDTSPLSSLHPTGASAFISSSYSGRLKHSHSLGAISPKGLTLRSGRLSSVDERDEQAEIDMERLCSASLANMKFYKRTRSVKESRELSSPKKTEEIFPKAKEQHDTPQKSATQAQKVTAGKNGTTTQSASSVMPTRAGKQSSLSLGQQDPLRRFKDVPSVAHGKRNGRGANLEVRQHPQERGLEATEERTRPSSDQNAPRKRTERGSLHQRASPHSAKEAETGEGKGSRQREVNQKATEVRSTSKEQNNRGSRKETGKQRSEVVSPREAHARQPTLSYSKEDSSKKILADSVNSAPEALQSPKGTLSPGPWKTPSSAKILSHAEVLLDPL